MEACEEEDVGVRMEVKGATERDGSGRRGGG